MIVYRTTNIKRRNSLSFLSDTDEQSALMRELAPQSWIDEVFNRSLPIPNSYQTRFGPPGFSKNPFYVSERPSTTHIEYAYGLLRTPSFVDKAVLGKCFEVKYQAKSPAEQVLQLSNSQQILDPKSYSAAHQWITSLANIPASVQYPSVRDQSPGGINYAIFDRLSVKATRGSVNELSFTPRANGSVEIQSLVKGGSPIVVTPIR